MGGRMRPKTYPPMGLFEAFLLFTGWGALLGFAIGVLVGRTAPSATWVGGLSLAAMLIAMLLLNRVLSIRVILKPTNKEKP